MRTWIQKWLLCALLFVSGVAYADPGEVLKLDLQRRAGEHQIQGSFKKNHYTSEAYQDTYPVEVPYEDQETYYEDVPYQAEETYYVDVPYQEEETYYEKVPYQETETYTERVPYTEREPYEDFEEYWENERKCRTHYENECRQERVCRTENERQCRSERVCRSEPGENQCKMVEECGTNAHGQRICKERKVCERGPDRQVCRDEQKCENHPREQCSTENKCRQVPKEKCENERVRKTRRVVKYREVTHYRDEVRTRTVTKYRDELRRRTVTKYRKEARTRTVTKYRKEARTRTVIRHRTEYKCCVTRYRDVFSHQETVEIKMVFPKNAELMGDERETFSINLLEAGKSPRVEIKVKESIYGYKVLSQAGQEGGVEVVLELVPKYQAKDLSEATVSELKMTLAPVPSSEGMSGKATGEFRVSFLDLGLRNRVDTKYRLQIKDKDTEEEVFDQIIPGSLESKNVQIPIGTRLDLYKDYDAVLQVYRTGVVLSGEVNFLKKTTYSFDRLNPDDFGAQTLKDLSLKETEMGLLAQWVDLGCDQRFETHYTAFLFRGKEKDLVFKQALTQDQAQSILIEKHLVFENAPYLFQLEVVREGRLLKNKVKFVVAKLFERNIQRDLFDGAEKIKGLALRGDGDLAYLEFQDLAPFHAQVKTEYEITMWGPGGFLGLQKTKFLAKSFSRASAGENSKGSNEQSALVRIALVRDLGLSAADAKKYLRPGYKIEIQLNVKRHSELFDGEKNILIQNKTTQKVEGEDSPWGSP